MTESIKLFTYKALRLYTVTHPITNTTEYRTGKCKFYLNDVNDVVEMDPSEFDGRKVLTICTATKDFFIIDDFDSFTARWQEFIDFYNTIDENAD